MGLYPGKTERGGGGLITGMKNLFDGLITRGDYNRDFTIFSLNYCNLFQYFLVMLIVMKNYNGKKMLIIIKIMNIISIPCLFRTY